MSNITAADVNKLRTMTGVGMMDCKKALVESDGDFDKAIEILRKKGQKVAMNRQDREAKEGYVIAKTTADNKRGIIIAIGCETDFVAKTEDFIKLATSTADLALAKDPKSLDELKSLKLNDRTVEENISDMMGKTGEKMELSKYEIVEAPKVIVYNHQGNRLATMVGFSKSDLAQLDAAGKDVAMQIAAMSPVAVDKDDVDPKIVEREIEIGKELAKNEGKPEQMLEKIALGKLNKFYQEYTLLNQDFIRDNKKTVRQYLSELDKDIKVTSFKRVQVGAK